MFMLVLGAIFYDGLRRVFSVGLWHLEVLCVLAHNLIMVLCDFAILAAGDWKQLGFWHLIVFWTLARPK